MLLPSPIPRSAVPPELTVWMVKSGFLLFGAQRCLLVIALLFSKAEASSFSASSTSSSSSFSLSELSALHCFPSTASWEWSVTVLLVVAWPSFARRSLSGSLPDSCSDFSSSTSFFIFTSSIVLSSLPLELVSDWLLMGPTFCAASCSSFSFLHGLEFSASSLHSSAKKREELSQIRLN